MAIFDNEKTKVLLLGSKPDIIQTKYKIVLYKMVDFVDTDRKQFFVSMISSRSIFLKYLNCSTRLFIRRATQHDNCQKVLSLGPLNPLTQMACKHSGVILAFVFSRGTSEEVADVTFLWPRN
ncbi:MAG: hypothetical protein WBZ36_19215 [Candidatus Nitrosopolaris sp.]